MEQLVSRVDSRSWCCPFLGLLSDQGSPPLFSWLEAPWLWRETPACFSLSQVPRVCGEAPLVLRVNIPLPGPSWGRCGRMILGRVGSLMLLFWA